MPIPRSSTKEFFIESKERSFLNPGEDEIPQEIDILAMLLNLFVSSLRSSETPHRSNLVTFTLIEVGSVRPTENPTLLLVENRISQRRDRNLNSSIADLSAHETTDENLNLIF